MQKAKFDIGEEAVHRFSLSAEDKATLELAEWVDSACKIASVCPLFCLNFPDFFMALTGFPCHINALLTCACDTKLLILQMFTFYVPLPDAFSISEAI